MNILIADDHSAIRTGIKHILTEEFGNIDFFEVAVAEEVISKSSSLKLDLIILDINFPGISGLDILKQLKSIDVGVPVLVFSFHQEDQFAVRALRAGASGFLSKDAPNSEILKAIRQILNGRKYISQKTAELMSNYLEGNISQSHELLSDREYQTLIMIAAGKSVSRIAEDLALSVPTISTYRTRILEKMKMKSNAEIIRYVIENKLT